MGKKKRYTMSKELQEQLDELETLERSGVRIERVHVGSWDDWTGWEEMEAQEYIDQKFTYNDIEYVPAGYEDGFWGTEHYVPVGEEHEHETGDGICWCKPRPTKALDAVDDNDANQTTTRVYDTDRRAYVQTSHYELVDHPKPARVYRYKEWVKDAPCLRHRTLKQVMKNEG